MKLIQDMYGSENDWIFSFSDDDKKACKALDDLLDKNLHPLAELQALEELMQTYPLDVDLLHHSALRLHDFKTIQNNNVQSYIYIQAAVSIALQAMPAEFKWTKHKVNEQALNNRPFFRAYSWLAGKYNEMGKIEESKLICERLTSISPRDGNGLRYLLVKFYQEEENLTELDKLISNYPDEDLIKNAKKN